MFSRGGKKSQWSLARINRDAVLLLPQCGTSFYRERGTSFYRDAARHVATKSKSLTNRDAVRINRGAVRINRDAALLLPQCGTFFYRNAARHVATKSHGPPGAKRRGTPAGVPRLAAASYAMPQEQ